MEAALSNDSLWLYIRSPTVSLFPLRHLLALRYRGWKQQHFDCDLTFIRLCHWLKPFSYTPAPPGFQIPFEFSNLAVLILLEQHARIPREAAYIELMRYFHGSQTAESLVLQQTHIAQMSDTVQALQVTESSH